MIELMVNLMKIPVGLDNSESNSRNQNNSESNNKKQTNSELINRDRNNKNKI